MKPIVFIVDDDASVRRSMSRLLRSEGISTEGFESAAQFLAADRHDGVGCLLLDINMPQVSGIELQSKLVEQGFDMPIIFLTGHGSVSNSVLAMKRGAIDFLTKPADEADLLLAVRQALDHHQRVREESKKKEAIHIHLESLTAREVEVMNQLITGASNKVVADRLQITIKTVKVHRGHVMQKMGVRSVAELLHLCHMVGIDPSDVNN